MKKVLFTVLSLFILSCSSDDNDNNSETTINPDLVGTWVGATSSDDDATEVGVQTIIFNQDGTGSLSETYVLINETFVVNLTWYSDDTTIYGTLEGEQEDEQDQIGYVLSEENTMLQLTFPEGDTNDYVKFD